MAEAKPPMWRKSTANPVGLAEWPNSASDTAVACACCNRGAHASSKSANAVSLYAAIAPFKFSFAPSRVSPMPTLDQMRVGEVARVESIRGDDAIVQRIMEMGLLEGEDVEVIGFAPLGDPMEVRLRDYRLSLRKAEASRVVVSSPTFLR